MSEILLGVNIDHIATLRNVRGTAWPDPVQAAFIAEQAGADSITVHMREDRRHINDRDIQLLRQTIQTRMNLEMAVTDKMIAIACKIKPHLCCLVPENRQELTTEGGLDIISQKNKLCQAISRLSEVGIQVSLFIDADEQQISAVTDVGATYIEIHTGTYANATDNITRDLAFTRISHSIQYAVTQGLKINAGHGINYHNVKQIATLPQIQELNIGHAIISRAVITGLSEAVKSMKHLIQETHN